MCGPKAHRLGTTVLLHYLKWQVPGQIDIVFVLVHPHLCYPQGVPLHCGAEVWHIGLVGPLNVGNLGARNNLYTPSTRPYLK